MTLTKVESQSLFVSCYDAASASLLWENSYASPQPSKIRDGKALFYVEKYRYLISLYANKAAVIRASDGEIVDEVETTASISSAGITASGNLIVFLDNGSIGVYGPDNPGAVVQEPWVNHDLDSMTYINQIEANSIDLLLAPNAKCVWLCREAYDEDYVPYQFDGTLPTMLEKVLVGDTLTLLGQDPQLYLFDLSEKTPGRTIDIPGSGYYPMYDLLGGDEAAGIVWIYCDDDTDQLIELDVSDGSIRNYQNEAGEIVSPELLPDGSFVYWYTDFPNGVLNAAESHLINAAAKNGILEETVLLNTPKKPDSYSIHPDLKAVVTETSGELQITDLITSNTIGLEGELRGSLEQVVWQNAETENAQASEGDLLAITDGYDAVILKNDGTEIARLSQLGSGVMDMASYQDELIVLYEGGKLTRYAWRDGTTAGSSNISLNGVESSSEKVTWTFSGNKLYLDRQGVNSYIAVIDLDSWEEEAMIPYGLCFDEARNRIVSYGLNEKSEIAIGYFPHYSVEELRQKAKDALHGTELTKEERESYGLE